MAETAILGRPSVYNQQIADEICERLSKGESLLSICRDERFPSDFTVRSWALSDRQGFSSQYTRARDLGLDAIADEVLSIADDGSNDTYRDDEGNVKVDYDHIARSKLRFDARRWYLSKLAPKKYGDATMLKHADADGNTLKVEVTRVSDAPRQLTPVKLLEASKVIDDDDAK